MTTKTAYGAPIRVERWRGRIVAAMPWPRPCARCSRPARAEVDGERLCRPCFREALV